MSKNIYNVDTELSLIEAYQLHHYYPDVVFEIHPLSKAKPLLFDDFDTANISKEVEYALWDILEIVNQILKNGKPEDGAEKLFPASLRLAGTLEMDYGTALELLEGFRGVLPSYTLHQIHQDMCEYTSKVLGGGEK